MIRSGTSTVCTAVTSVLLLLVGTAPSLAMGPAQDTLRRADLNLTHPLLGDDLESGAELLDDVIEQVLDKVLRQVVAGMASPQKLREHVLEAMAKPADEDAASLSKPWSSLEGLESAVMHGAADCDLNLARWATGLVHMEKWALQSELS